MTGPGPQSIDELLAAADQAAETEAPKAWLPVPGEQFHFLVPGFSFLAGYGSESMPVGVVSTRGQTVTITDGLVEASKDRFGVSWLDLVDHPELQVERWGEIKFKPGPAPAHMRPYRRGSIEEDLARDRALRQAQIIRDPDEQAEAMRRIAAEFGRAPTSKTIAQLDGGRDA